MRKILGTPANLSQMFTEVMCNKGIAVLSDMRQRAVEFALFFVSVHELLFSVLFYGRKLFGLYIRSPNRNSRYDKDA